MKNKQSAATRVMYVAVGCAVILLAIDILLILNDASPYDWLFHR
ncbi:MAG: hypothetical protein ACWA5X_06895 [bacterium]